MKCPLCGERKARRGCPALQREICAVCCGTKRLTEIRCPSDCPYLASAREHPPAATLRQQQKDASFVIEVMRDFNDRQSQLFLMVAAFLLRYQGSELQPLIDEDVAGAAGSLAATLETAARGVIYEHRAASPPAGRLAGELKNLLAEAGKAGGSSFDRDAAVVLRHIEQAVVAAARSVDGGGSRPFLGILGRMMRQDDTAAAGAASKDAPRLIVP